MSAYYTIVVYDGGNGATMRGITTKEEIEQRYGPVEELSPNNDGLLELGDTGTLAVPHEGKDYDWEHGLDDRD